MDLTKILKEVSQMVFKGEMTFEGIIKIENSPDTNKCVLTADGRHCLNGEYVLHPSKDLATEEEQRLFDAIKANGYEWGAEKKELKKIEEKFSPETLQPFDKVLVRDGDDNPWGISFFSHFRESGLLRFSCVNLAPWRQCVPYNDDTKHLVGIRDKAPEKYINW